MRFTIMQAKRMQSRGELIMLCGHRLWENKRLVWTPVTSIQLTVTRVTTLQSKRTQSRGELMDKVTLQKMPAILLLEINVNCARACVKHLRYNPNP